MAAVLLNAWSSKMFPVFTFLHYVESTPTSHFQVKCFWRCGCLKDIPLPWKALYSYGITCKWTIKISTFWQLSIMFKLYKHILIYFYLEKLLNNLVLLIYILFEEWPHLNKKKIFDDILFLVTKNVCMWFNNRWMDERFLKLFRRCWINQWCN